jgi:hypothetical protein
MALTGAQRTAAYRRRLKQDDPEAYEAMMQYSRARASEWREKNPEKKDAYNKKHRFYAYGLTDAHIKELHRIQHGCCAICKKPIDLSQTRKWTIDHHHEFGTVRGILCYPCNVAIGQFKDSIAMLVDAIDYLDSPPALDLDTSTLLVEETHK